MEVLVAVFTQVVYSNRTWTLLFRVSCRKRGFSHVSLVSGGEAAAVVDHRCTVMAQTFGSGSVVSDGKAMWCTAQHSDVDAHSGSDAWLFLWQ